MRERTADVAGADQRDLLAGHSIPFTRGCDVNGKAAYAYPSPGATR